MTDANRTLSVNNELPDEARCMFINLTGTLTVSRDVICPAVSKLYFVHNATNQVVVFKTLLGTGVSIPVGSRIALYCNATNVVPAVDDLPAASKVAGIEIVTVSGTQTLTNKTINLTSNTLQATSAQIAAAVTDETGTGALVFAGSPALTGTPTAPTAAAGTNTTQVATTAHVFAERTNTATLTNKTISGADNTLSNIGNASLTNSSITFGSTAQALGSTVSALNGVSIGATTASTGAFTTLSATGVTTVQAGTAAAPAITTSGDTNTGIFFPAADTIAFTEGGVERMRIDNAGNVGIGRAPTGWVNTYRMLQVGSGNGTASLAGSVDSVSNISLTTNARNADGTVWRYLDAGFASRYDQIDSGHRWFTAASGAAAGNEITWQERMRITSAGNVGIGTSSPGSYSGYTTLSVNGSTGGIIDLATGGTRIGSVFSTSSSFELYTLSAIPIVFTTNNTERMRIDSAGNVGIGTSSPGGRLDVVSATQINDAYNPAAFFGTSASGTQGGAIGSRTISANTTQGLYISSGQTLTLNASAGIRFQMGALPATAVSTATEVMRIDSSGNLLIGKTTATANGGDLQVSSGITFPATQVPKSNANTLDDYEEGTWTPEYAPSSGSFQTMSYMSFVGGTYTKIGRIVHLQGTLATNNVNLTGASGDLRITGLPFNIVRVILGRTSGGTIGAMINFASAVSNTRLAYSFTANHLEIFTNSTNAATGRLQVSALTTGATNDKNYLVFDITYQTT
jgi:hypothetical protein